jgi:hypothetical protein
LKNVFLHISHELSRLQLPTSSWMLTRNLIVFGSSPCVRSSPMLLIVVTGRLCSELFDNLGCCPRLKRSWRYGRERHAENEKSNYLSSRPARPHPLFLLSSPQLLLRSSTASSSLAPTPTLAPIHPLSLLPHTSPPDRAPQDPGRGWAVRAEVITMSAETQKYNL